MGRPMNKEEVNKYLTKAMGETAEDKDGDIKFLVYNDFFTNEGYGKLRDWYDEWDEERKAKFTSFILKPVLATNPAEEDLSDFCVIRIMQVFHRDRLAKLIYEFLKEEE